MPTHPHPEGSLDRRTVLRYLAGLGLVGPAAAALASCGMGDDDQSGMRGMGGSGMSAWMMGDGMMDAQMMADMAVIHELLTGHDRIRREVHDTVDGIRSRTTSTDSRLAGLIRNHVRAMRARIEDNRPIRQGDPLFREIFEHHAAIAIEVSDLPNGVEVAETSADAQVQLLIRQHARWAVSEFVASGMARAMQPTPLPEGYHG